MIDRLVGFDTVSRHSNLDLIDYVHDYLADLGVASHRVASANGEKSSLFATVGPAVAGGVVLSGHTDVVPVDGQIWATEPFTVTEKDGRLYGRGTSDMKSFIATALAKVPDMLEAGLAKPLHFALSYDEEVGCQGAPALIARLADAIPPVEAVIVGEPTRMRPVKAHKGIAVVHTTVTGHEAHSSQLQRGVSAVMTAAKLIDFLAALTAENKAQADPQSPFVPPYTTLHVGVVHGGTALNIIARECKFTWDVRQLPSDELGVFLDRFQAYCDECLKEMKTIASDVAITTELEHSVPPLAGDKDTSAQQLALALTGESSCDVVPFASEGGQFQERGFSVVLCGPGSINQAHQPDEYIDISQVDACESFLDKLLSYKLGR
jgi:acetylornithine deacetylase